jgi:hypothetical protein
VRPWRWRWRRSSAPSAPAAAPAPPPLPATAPRVTSGASPRGAGRPLFELIEPSGAIACHLDAPTWWELTPDLCFRMTLNVHVDRPLPAVDRWRIVDEWGERVLGHEVELSHPVHLVVGDTLNLTMSFQMTVEDDDVPI